MRRKSVISLLLIAGCILSLTGCGGQTTAAGEKNNQQIELLEPVNTETTYEVASLRNLYGAAVYAASVVPYIEEYIPENALFFGGYAAYPGETVKKGQELIVSDTTNVDEQIKAKEEYIATMQENHEKFLEDQQKALETYREDQSLWNYYVELNEKQEPPKYIETEEGRVENPEHATWQTGYDMVTGKYRIAKHAGDTVELKTKQQSELYAMDLEHQKYLLKQLKESRRRATVQAKMDGEIVAMQVYQQGNYIGTDRPVAAVGDRSQKFLKCDYINKSIIKNAEDVYAVIDGKRYEVEYQALSTEEYQELTAKKEKIYSTFILKDVGEDVEVGDFAVISVISNHREDVVSIPKGAIHKDDSGNFVYVLKEDGSSAYTSIQTGFSDGNYTEIVYGLEAGDKVVYTPSQSAGSETVKLEKGEFHTDFSGRAYIEYPSSTYLKNPIENGTVYFGELLVENYQHVEKGDVIATVRVAPDSIALTRNETRMTRLKERLENYKKDNKGSETQEYYINTVKSYDEQIEDLAEVIAKQKKDFAATQIVADRSGVIVQVWEYNAEDIVQRNANIVRIADESTCYVLVEDSNQVLQYGNQVEVSYNDAYQVERKVDGVIASMSPYGVSASLQQEFAYVKLPQDKISDMLAQVDPNNSWSRYRYTVRAKLRSMENVVVVPKRAVYDFGGKTYVYVKEADGTVKFQSFVSGGYNDKYYWVVEGLTEGMEVCLK